MNDRVPDASEWLLTPQLPGCHCSRNCCRASLNDLLACPTVVGTGRRNASVTERSQRAGKHADRIMSALVAVVRRSCMGAQRSGGGCMPIVTCRTRSWRTAARAGDPATVGAVPNYVAQTLWPAGGITDGACGSVWRAIQYDRVAPGPEPDHPPVSQRVRPASTRRPVGRDGVTPVTGAALMRPADGPSADGRSTRRCTRRATCPDDASVHIRARVAAAPSRDEWARRHAGARVDRVWPPQIRGHGVLWRHTDARPAIGPPQHDEARDARPGVRAGRGTPWHRSRLRTPSIASTAPTGRRWAG